MQLPEPILSLFSRLPAAPSQTLPLLPIFAIIEPSATATGSPNSSIWASTTMSLPLDPLQTIYAASSANDTILFRILKERSDTVLEISFPQDLLRKECVNISTEHPNSVFPTPPGWLGTINPGKVWPVAPSTLTLPTAVPTNYGLRTEYNRVTIEYYVGDHEYELDVPVMLDIMKQMCKRYGDLPDEKRPPRPTTTQKVRTTEANRFCSVRLTVPTSILQQPSTSSTSKAASAESPDAKTSSFAVSTVWFSSPPPLTITSSSGPDEMATTSSPDFLSIPTPSRSLAVSGISVTMTSKKGSTVSSHPLSFASPTSLSDASASLRRTKETDGFVFSHHRSSTSVSPIDSDSSTDSSSALHKVTTESPARAKSSSLSTSSSFVTFDAVTPLPHLFHPNPGEDVEADHGFTRFEPAGSTQLCGYVSTKTVMVTIYEPEEHGRGQFTPRGEQTKTDSNSATISAFTGKSEVSTQDSSNAAVPLPTIRGLTWKNWWTWRQPRALGEGFVSEQSMVAPTRSTAVPERLSGAGNHPETTTNTSSSFNISDLLTFFDVVTSSGSEPASSTSTPTSTFHTTSSSATSTSHRTAPTSTEALALFPSAPPHFPTSSLPSSYKSSIVPPSPEPSSLHKTGPSPDVILPSGSEHYPTALVFTYADWALIAWMLLSGLWQFQRFRRPAGRWWIGERLRRRFEARAVWAWWG